MRKLKIAVAAAGLGLLLAGGQASAQVAVQGGLVNVNVQDVIGDIALDLNVNVSQIPVTVQVPIGVAANVCDVNANVLAAQRKAGGASCDAKSTSTALNQFTQRQLLLQN